MRITFHLLVVLAILLPACSGMTGKDDPAAPAVSPASVANPAHSNRSLLGMWDVKISEDRQTLEVAPMRVADLHLNATRLLEVTPCTTCLSISNLTVIPPDRLQVDVTLKHPFPGLLKYTGFDVRGIFVSQADYAFPPTGRSIAWGDGVPRMLNWDGYTSLFNPAEFPPTTPPALGYVPGKKATGGDLTATLNPFVAYRKDAPRRMFEAGGSETRSVLIQAPTGPIHFGYAIDVSWFPVEDVIDPLTDFPLSANCLEAYRIDADSGTGMMPSDGGMTGVEVKVYDHQGLDTTSSVSVLSPFLFNGETTLSLSPDTGTPYALYSGIIKNDLSAGQGTYPLLVRVTDKESDPNLGTIDAWQVYDLKVEPREGWARTWGGTNMSYMFEQAKSVCVDANGDIVTVGECKGFQDFDPGPGEDFHSDGPAYVSKYDKFGNFKGAVTWGAHSYEVATDNQNNIYISGVFMGSVDFDPGPGEEIHTVTKSPAAYLLKLNADGIFRWVRTWGGEVYALTNVQPGKIVVDNSGYIYVTGGFMKSVDFDPGPGEDIHTVTGDNECIYLTKFTFDGDWLGVNVWGGNSVLDTGRGVGVDSSGSVYVTGRFSGTSDFDPGTGEDIHTSNGGGDIFLSKFNSTGAFQWAKTWGSSLDDPGSDYYYSEEGWDIAFDSENNAYVTGTFYMTVDFDPGPGEDWHISDKSPDVFLSKFNPSGEFQWARTWGGESDLTGYGVDTDPLDNVLVTGVWGDGAVDFDPGPGEDWHETNQDGLYVSKFNKSGDFIYATIWDELIYSLDIATDDSGDAYISGGFVSYGDGTDFDPGLGVDKHSSNGFHDSFIMKLPSDGNW